MKYNAVVCDTSFFIRLLDKNDPLHSNAKGYFRFFLENDYRLLISTIAIAEYCVVGALDELPLKNLQIVPFNLDHSIRTAELAQYVFKNKGKLKLRERNIIQNDTKLLPKPTTLREQVFIFLLTPRVLKFTIY
jgi:predicted nucleic acid-binding protein